jgi:ribosomal protein S18 acetylase RimI-like enzyme
VVWYRPFRNTDPPRLLALWHAAGFGRGAAEGFTTDAFEVLVFSQPYFERGGMLLAFPGEEREGDESRALGFVHVGFAANDDGSGIDRETGVVCAIAVLPEARRSGIGGELLRRGIAHLREQGATTILAGPSAGVDPFYIGMYGGARISGFLESDPAAGPFLVSRGFTPIQTHAVFGRDLDDTRDPVNFRLVTVRRKMELRVGPEPARPNRWWLTRFGRLDSVRFLLCPKPGGAAVAGVTVVGLDLYVKKWNARAVGLMDVFVPEEERRNGYAQTLLLEVCRRLREELVTRVEIHIPDTNEAGASLLRSCAFEEVDRGVVYRLDE